ncbi:GNAT family N-acetyltransferase [Haloterrigena sp. SYSU A121-1]|uniref:GNAT family N-acetyltransferase n=1 Tax=Haloterrigena gelatinilytica TaxID=2741724 RepID=A0A8J8KGQ2_9EURY|nr:GNAT family N-acetyltransferase [Haloterrigena gelatinilytica]NUB92756.1 GNAT family N-acetyltransferase [Haloterrigena gelatinilytica]
MSIRVSVADPSEQETWNRYVDRSPQGTVFHRYEALECLRDHSGATLYPLVGYKGNHPVGIFPVFELNSGPFSLVFSPPYELGIPNLGPALLDMDQMKQRKQEKRHLRFFESCLEWIDDEIDPQYTYVETDWHYEDTRPFAWNDFDVSPSYTYVVPLDDSPSEEELIGRFSQNPRRLIRDAQDGDYSVDVGDRDDVAWITQSVIDRYEEQGRTPHLSVDFVTELYDRLPEGTVRPLILSLDGERVTGNILTDTGDRIRHWQGGARVDMDLPANELVEWHGMLNAIERDVPIYELVGANTRRITTWKAKFSPETRTYYSAKRSTMSMELAESLYVNLRDSSELLSRLSPATN